tara:strand:+ start:226 stop:414 length:189 start_codon:yes stop_codon:yes gene_type:complete
MKIGDLVKVVFNGDGGFGGHGLYMGIGKRKAKPIVHVVYWKGRIATFDRDLWKFTVISSPIK